MGLYLLSLDDKGRMLLPVEVRHKLDPAEDGFMIVVGVNGQPWLYPERLYESMVSSLASQLSVDEDRLAFDQMYLSTANRAMWDKQGRMLIPVQIRQETGLERDAVMIEARDRYELWNRETWVDRR